MFNKPSVFGRNDPITRRDAQPVLGSGNPSAMQSPEKTSPVTKVSSESASAIQPAKPAVVAATPEVKDVSAVENVLEARLIVGPEVKLKGAEILDCDTLVVEGRVEATMDSRVIRIAEHGSFVGKVSIDIAEIHGSFEGELTARSQLIIHSTGRVSGTIRYGKLVADEGCELCGDINVLSAPVAPKSRPVIEPFVTLNAAAG